jgi:trehalose-phosphatase
VALFLDFDGTLAPTRPRPEHAVLEESTRRALRRLVHCRGVHVFVISGRKLDDIRSRVRVPGVTLLGLHGWDRGRGNKLNTRSRLLVDTTRRQMGEALPTSGQVWIEDKGATFSVHYRAATAAEVRQARAALSTILDPLRGALRVLQGDMVWEVAPREVRGKGVAARSQFRAYRHALPVYAGNDATDEPAFQALARGVTIRVGPLRPSRAHFHLRNPAELRRFLENLLEEKR